MCHHPPAILHIPYTDPPVPATTQLKHNVNACTKNVSMWNQASLKNCTKEQHYDKKLKLYTCRCFKCSETCRHKPKPHWLMGKNMPENWANTTLSFVSAWWMDDTYLSSIPLECRVTQPNLPSYKTSCDNFQQQHTTATCTCNGLYGDKNI